jgi:hypothetical protein
MHGVALIERFLALDVASRDHNLGGESDIPIHFATASTRGGSAHLNRVIDEINRDGASNLDAKRFRFHRVEAAVPGATDQLVTTRGQRDAEHSCLVNGDELQHLPLINQMDFHRARHTLIQGLAFWAARDVHVADGPTDSTFPDSARTAGTTCGNDRGENNPASHTHQANTLRPPLRESN